MGSDLERYLQLQKGVQAQQPAQENLLNLFEIESILLCTSDEQLINTIYLHLAKQFHHFNQGVQHSIYMIFQQTCTLKFSYVFNKQELLEILQDHFRSLDQITRTLSMKILACLAPFYPQSIETFHIVLGLLIKSDYEEEITSCIDALRAFLEHGSSYEFSLRLLVAGPQILAKCGETIYNDLLLSLKLNHRSVQQLLYDQLLELICRNDRTAIQTDRGYGLDTRHLRLIIRVCRANPDLAADFFAFSEANFEEFGSDESAPMLIQDRPLVLAQAFKKSQSTMQGLSLNKSTSSSSNTITTVTAAAVASSSVRTKKDSLSTATSQFSLKLKQMGSSLNSMIEKKVKSVKAEKKQANLINTIFLIYSWSRHLNVSPSHSLNEMILKAVSKFNISTVKKYIEINDDVDRARFYSGIATSWKNILLQLETVSKSKDSRRVFGVLHSDDFNTTYVDENFQSLQQPSRGINEPSDISLLFENVGLVFQKLSFQLSTQPATNANEPWREFCSKNDSKFSAAIALISPLPSKTNFQLHFVNLLESRVFKIYVALYRRSLACDSAAVFFNHLNLLLCVIYNKLHEKQPILRFLSKEFIMNLPENPQTHEKNLLKRTASQFACYNIFKISHEIFTLISDEIPTEKQNLQIRIINIFDRMSQDQTQPQEYLLQLYDVLLLSRLPGCSFEVSFLEFLCEYYALLNSTKSLSGNLSISQLLVKVQMLMSNRFHSDSATRSTLRFIRCLLHNIQDFYAQPKAKQQKFKPSFHSLMEENEGDQPADEEEFDELNSVNDSLSDTYTLGYFIDGRQAVIEKILKSSPYSNFIEVLKRIPLVLPRQLFVSKLQPSMEITINDSMISSQLRAEKGFFVTGELRLKNIVDRKNAILVKCKATLSVSLDQLISPAECVYKQVFFNKTNLSTAPNKLKQSRGEGTVENLKKHQNHMVSIVLPFASLVTFPHIGNFTVNIKADFTCPKTGLILFSARASPINLQAD